MTPDAGHSENVGTNRGFVSIPEIGDQVIIGYRYGDPNRPFIMGSLFHGINGAGGDVNNKIKSFTTKSGSTITFNDDEGSVFLKDADKNNNNQINFDGKGNIELVSGETITLGCGNSMIKLEKCGTITLSGTDIIVHGSNSVGVISVPNESGGGTGTVNISAKQTLSLASQEENINLIATNNVFLQSGQIMDIKGGGQACVTAPIVNIN